MTQKPIARLNAAEAARALDLSEKTIRRHLKKGTLKAVKTPNEHWAIDVDEVKRFGDLYAGHQEGTETCDND